MLYVDLWTRQSVVYNVQPGQWDSRNGCPGSLCFSAHACLLTSGSSLQKFMSYKGSIALSLATLQRVT